VLSHLYLDWTNIFGVRLLEPFSRRYYHLDTTGVTDLWMLAVLGAVAGWFVIAHLVSSEIGARKASGRGAAIAALLFVCLWQSGRYFAHERAVAMLDARMYDGETPRRVAALPNFASPLHWTGVVETESAYRLFEFSLTEGGFDPLSGDKFYKPEPSASMEVAKQTESFQQFLRFADFALWQVLPAAEPEGATEVRVMDIRFGIPGEGRFVATAVVDRTGQLLRDWFQFDPPGGYPRLR
jgi:inner membrane protein